MQPPHSSTHQSAAASPASAHSTAQPAIFTAVNALLYCKKMGMVWRYWRKFGLLPNIADPKRYSERMFWRKVLDHNPQFVRFSDKLATKEYLGTHCPDLPVPRTLWVGHDADAIPDDLLRQDVYVKASHGCGFNHRVRGTCDRALLRKKTRRWLRSGYGKKNGEWAYSQVPRQLFVEESIGDAEIDMLELNLRACNGRVILGSVIGQCKTPKQWVVYLDAAGAPTRGMTDPEEGPITPLPAGVELLEPYRRAVQFTERLSVGVDYARFDFLFNGHELYGGEITVYPASGIAEPSNTSVNRVILGGWDLTLAQFLNAPHRGWRRRYAAAFRDLLVARSVARDREIPR